MRLYTTISLTVASKRYKSIIREVVKVELASGVVAKVRVVFVDNSFFDIHWSPSGRYSLHYERRHVDGTVYRHDNAPHEKHRHVRTFPKHFHRGSEDRVEESYLPEDPIDCRRALPEIHTRIDMYQAMNIPYST